MDEFLEKQKNAVDEFLEKQKNGMEEFSEKHKKGMKEFSEKQKKGMEEFSKKQIDGMIEFLEKQKKEGMDELTEVAQAYYRACPSNIKALAKDFFKSLDVDGKKKVSYSQFEEYFSLGGGNPLMRNPDLFNELGVDKNGTLGRKEVRTLFYILNSGRSFCGGCGVFITGVFFVCIKCFESDRIDYPYCVCLQCYRDESKRDQLNQNHTHKLEQFMDNTAILHFNRKSIIKEAKAKAKAKAKAESSKNMQQTPTQSASATIVPYRPNNQMNKLEIFKYLVLAVELAVVAAGCNIM